MIEFLDVAKRFGRTTALRRVTFSVPAGAALLLRGANGSGKSTILRIAAGLALPDSGRVVRVARRVGYVGHRDQLLPSWSVRATLDSQTRILAGRPVDWRPVAEQWGVDAFWDKRPAQLSRGMAQRAALVRAFAIRAELLVLDEPETGLDIAGRELLRAEIARAIERGATVLIASHTEEIGTVGAGTLEVHDGVAA